MISRELSYFCSPILNRTLLKVHMRNLISRKWIELLAYWLLATALFFYLDYAVILNMIPQGIHFIRQTDSLSIIIHYLKSGMNFWEPGILNLESIDGHTASEFPIIYYMIAWIYRIIGDHEIILRLVNIALVFTGFYHVYRIIIFQIGHIALSLTVTFTLFGSMVILYYTNNFLPDTGAFGLTLTGMYYLYVYLQDDTLKINAIKGMILMCIASLIKVSYFVYPTAFVLTIAYNQLKTNNQNLVGFIKLEWKLLLLYVSGLIAVAGWVMYIKHYNETYNGYFLVKSRSILVADQEDKIQVMKHVTGWWADSYYPTLTKYFLLILFSYSLFRYKETERKWLHVGLLSLAGAFAFFLLFFLQFRDHDYYFIALIPAIIIATIYAVTNIYHLYTSNLIRTLLLVLMGIVCIKGIAFSKQKLWTRYAESKNDLYSKSGQLLFGYDAILDSAGISRDAKLVLIVDKTVNGGLYFTRRFGWSIMDTTERYTKQIPVCIASGATHIMLLDSGYENISGIAEHLGTKVLSRDFISLYTIKP